ncbi:unnamed protein product, partial [Didymodactylos carnosus]
MYEYRILLFQIKNYNDEMNINLNTDHTLSTLTDLSQQPEVISTDDFHLTFQSIIDRVQINDQAYCSGGRIHPLWASCLEVNHIGKISLPLTDEDAEILIKQCKPLKTNENTLYNGLQGKGILKKALRTFEAGLLADLMVYELK